LAPAASVGAGSETAGSEVEPPAFAARKDRHDESDLGDGGTGADARSAAGDDAARRIDAGGSGPDLANASACGGNAARGLALWQQQALSVVLYADVSADGCAMGLLDALGGGIRTLHYEVEVALRDARRPGRLGGVGNFRDLRQLARAGQGSP